MRCPRCSGLLVVDAFSDLQSTFGTFDGARCLNCGYIEDSLMIANRQAAAQRDPTGVTVRRSSARLRSPLRLA